jgi:acyl carrier protein
VAQQTTMSIDAIKEWIISRNEGRQDVGADEDLIDCRLVDSLSFVEFIFLIEEVSGEEIDVDKLDLNDVRTLAAIKKRFLPGWQNM